MNPNRSNDPVKFPSIANSDVCFNEIIFLSLAGNLLVRNYWKCLCCFHSSITKPLILLRWFFPIINI